MYSFYGGRPGNSFVIITTYESVADMVSNFKLGPDYSAVHYDEHVMINTVNKNDPDNGKIYRRGYDFNNEMGGAEYIGTVVGPAGKAPMLELTTITDVASKHAAEGFDERSGSGRYALTNESLVPGKTQSGEYNDAITWAYYSMRDENGEDSTAYIGFTFPYTVIEFETVGVSPYDNAEHYIDASSAIRIDDQTHPFYEKWRLNIPKGIKGSSVANLTVETPTASSNIENYDGQSDDINNQRQILTYEYYNYDESENGNPVKRYLGDYNMIDNIMVGNDGTITIDYTHNDNTVLDRKIKWIDSVNLNNGTFTVNFNNGSQPYRASMDWVTGIGVANDGTINVYHANEAHAETLNNKIKWIKSMNLDANGLFNVTYNDDSQFQKTLDWVNEIDVAANGVITIKHSNSANTVLSNKIKWIKDISVQTENPAGAGQGTGDQQLYITWNDNSAPEPIGNPINYIMDMAVDGNNRLLVRYSDPDKRKNTGITYNSLDGWTNLGTIAQEEVFGPGSVNGLNWIGVGQLIDPGPNGTGEKTIKFTIAPTAIINADNIAATGGTLAGTFGNNITFTSSNTTITKTLFGLQFEVKAGTSGSSASTSFVNLSISGLNLSLTNN